MENPSRLLNRNFFLLWQGQLVSQTGNQVAIVAMLFWIEQTTDSASLVGLIMMVSALPSVLLGPIGGTFADHYSRRAIIVYSDLFSGLAGLSLAGLIFIAPEKVNLILVWLFVVSSLIALFGSFFRPAITAAIPDIVPQNQVARANSLNEASEQIATFIGYGLGGVLFQFLGAPVLFLFNGLTFLFSAASESFITIPQATPASSTNWKQAFRKFQIDTAEGFRYLWHKDGMKALFLAAASLNVFAVPIFVLLPFYVKDFLRVSASWYGFLMAAFGAGCLAGYVTASVIRFSGKSRSTMMSLLVLGTSLALAGLGFVRIPLVALLLMFGLGTMIGLVNVVAITILQVTTPDYMRGRIFGLLGTLSQALTPLAMGLSGLIADWSSQNIPLIYIACGGISLVIAITLSMNQKLHDFLAYEQ
jgi:MFS family permease